MFKLTVYPADGHGEPYDVLHEGVQTEFYTLVAARAYIHERWGYFGSFDAALSSGDETEIEGWNLSPDEGCQTATICERATSGS